MPSFDVIVVLAVIVTAMVLWITEWWPVDQVSLCIPVVLVIVGVLGPGEAFAGFAGTAVVTIAGILVVSDGLVRTGAVQFVGERIVHWSGGDENKLLLLVMLTMLVSSVFINNTAIVAMFLPVLLSVAHEFEIAPSKVLIPLSFASILGGTCSLIGTSTNLLVHDLMMDEGLDGLGMFEITPVGAVLGGVGLLYLYFPGVRLLPERGSATAYHRVKRGATEYMTEVHVPEGSTLVGSSVDEAVSSLHPDLTIMRVIRGEELLSPPFEEIVLQGGDVLLLQGDVNELLEVYRQQGIAMLPELREAVERWNVKDMSLAELVITPNSPLIRKTLDEVGFRRRFGVTVMALQRHEAHRTEKITDVPLENGDVLLVMGEASDVDGLEGFEEFLTLEGVQEVVVRRDKAWLAAGIVVALVASVSLGLESVMVLAVLAALAMVVTGCLTLGQAYGALDLSVLFLIGGALSLGQAMQASGAADLIAAEVVAAVASFGPHALLATIYGLTLLLTAVMTNNAAAVLMVPLAVSAAGKLGLDPRPFAIAVAFAGSAAFATPIGYQTNTLVYGAGDYEFLDFTRVGLPLNLVLWVATVFLIPLWWPF